MFRKNELAARDWSIEKVQRCARIQEELLEMAAEMLAPGGILLYSTCSFSKEEDIDPILALLSAHPEFSMVPLPEDPAYFHHPDLPEAIFLFPHRYEGEGQFIAKLQKAGQPPLFAVRPRPAPKGNPFVETYGLQGRDFLIKDGSLYSLNSSLPTYRLPLLRYGVKIEEGGNPDFALARFLPAKSCISLNEVQAKAYLTGLTFELDVSKGFHPLAYQGLSLGFAKVSGGVAKNHYPKGLRRDYAKDLFPFLVTADR
jgi:hypothetical protein